jgi:histidine triad (HIT) family protein
MECIFCKIIKGEIPSNKVLENDKFYAFHDINPVAPVHVLIIPKEHYEKFDKTPVELMPEMAEFIKETAKALGITDYRLITNNGSSAGQEVFHLHIHMVANPKGKLLWTELT